MCDIKLFRQQSFTEQKIGLRKTFSVSYIPIRSSSRKSYAVKDCA